MKRFRKPASVQLVIMDLLKRTKPMPMTAEMIAGEIGIDVAHARCTLGLMRLCGRVRRTKRGGGSFNYATYESQT